MDRTVPAGAAMLLDFIGKTEVGTADADGYGVIYAHKQHKLAKPLTRMTLAEVQTAQRSWSKNHGSSAAGRYQFMRATLKGLIEELRLRQSQLLDADLQDRLGYHLLKRRGYEDFMAGKMNRTEFGARLAMEWASFPVLRARKGAHRGLSRGQSYYAGDSLNKALVKPEEVEAVLDAVFAEGNALVQPPQPDVPSPKPEPQPVDDPVPMPEPVEPADGKSTTKAAVGLFGLIVLAVAAAVAFLKNGG